jgi:uncharacterized membrane protein
LGTQILESPYEDDFGMVTQSKYHSHGKALPTVPDHRIAWESEGGEYTSGIVNFATVNPNCTRVSLELMYDPEGFVEKTGDALGVVSSRVEGDLERFNWRENLHGP